jgi:hypothetical protein
MGCKPGPNPVLSTPVEDKLSNYLVEMADMGFGLSRKEVMRLAFQIADKSGIKHPFKNGAAGRKWFVAFRSRHPNQMLSKPESLSYVRAKAVNPVTIQDFFAKLGALYTYFNLLTKPMQENDVHLLCLPSHTTHVLQPLDVGMFSSFKYHVGLALNTLLRSSEGRVPTSEDIPVILSEAWPKSVTPVNLMSGFRKSGIHPLYPCYIHNRAFAPSIATCPSEQSESPVSSLTEGSATAAEDDANMTEKVLIH